MNDLYMDLIMYSACLFSYAGLMVIVCGIFCEDEE